MNSHIEKLTKSAQSYINSSTEDRIKKCKEQVWIPYTKAKEILSELDELYEHPKKERMPNLLLVGNTNNGKSTILNRFIKKHPNNIDVINIVPIVKISAPISPSHNALYEKLLDELFVPYGTNEPISRKEYQLKKVLQDVKTKMIIIDEFQDIFHGDIKKQRQFLAGLKHLGTDLQIPIIGAGVWEVQNVISADPQMANRFETMKLDKWKPDIEFAKLLTSFESTIPLKEPSNLHSKELFTKIYNLSEGMIGEVARIIQKASVYALKHNKESIDINILNSINFIPPSERRK